MERFVPFDIETLPTVCPEAICRIIAGMKSPPKTIKDEQKRLDWTEAAVKEAVAKTSFDPAYGRCLSIGYAKGLDAEPVVVYAEDPRDEAEMISRFFAALDPYHAETLAGHWVTGFDIPFLTRRAIILGVNLPDSASWPRQPKAWDCFDTMHKWSGLRDRISLDDLCFALNIEGKDAFDGSMVADAYAANEHSRIKSYQASDVRKIQQIVSRFQAVGF